MAVVNCFFFSFCKSFAAAPFQLATPPGISNPLHPERKACTNAGCRINVLIVTRYVAYTANLDVNVRNVGISVQQVKRSNDPSICVLSRSIVLNDGISFTLQSFSFSSLYRYSL